MKVKITGNGYFTKQLEIDMSKYDAETQAQILNTADPHHFDTVSEILHEQGDYVDHDFEDVECEILQVGGSAEKK